jgi:hypothetical protein
MYRSHVDKWQIITVTLINTELLKVITNSKDHSSWAAITSSGISFAKVELLQDCKCWLFLRVFLNEF